MAIRKSSIGFLLAGAILAGQEMSIAQAADVSVGTSSQLDRYRSPYPYKLPPGKSPRDIVGMGIAGSNDHVYVWFQDGTVSSGTSDDLAYYRSLYRYSTPRGKAPRSIVGLGIAGSNDHVFAWYSD